MGPEIGSFKSRVLKSSGFESGTETTCKSQNLKAF